MNDIPSLLRSRGLKVTPQRIAIYTMLANTKVHPSAEVIYKTLEKDNPTMSLATVYKTLDSFQSNDLIQVLSVGDGSSRYDAETKSHPHMVCKSCGNVYDFESDELGNIGETAQKYTDFKIESEQLFFFGVCKECFDQAKK